MVSASFPEAKVGMMSLLSSLFYDVLRTRERNKYRAVPKTDCGTQKHH